MKIPQKIKNRLTVYYSNSTLEYLFKENENTQKDIGTPMFIAVFFTKTKIRKQPRCLSMDGWIKKMWYIYNGILLSYKEE